MTERNEGHVDETWDIRPESHQRNMPLLRGDDYVAGRGRYIYVERFSPVHAGPEGVATFIHEKGRRKKYRLGVWQ